jgi:hypothetical protein
MVGKYITLEDYGMNFMNGPKRLWKILSLSGFKEIETRFFVVSEG